MNAIEDRFWAKVDKSGECWTWTASRDLKGYGYFQFRGRVSKAHRVAWTLSFGEIPTGLLVLHRCDNPRCVRPAHLVLGTNDDNMADMVAKGRAAHGSRTVQAKLDEDAVRDIRRLLAEGCSTETLGPRFGVDPSAIRQIARGETWRHVR